MLLGPRQLPRLDAMVLSRRRLLQPQRQLQLQPQRQLQLQLQRQLQLQQKQMPNKTRNCLQILEPQRQRQPQQPQ